MIKVRLFNDDDRMRDIDSYGKDYGFNATFITSRYNEDSESMEDEWILEGEEEGIEAFIEDYCLEEVVEYL